MTKNKFISSAILSAFFIALISCNGGTKGAVETKAEEVIPEDIGRATGRSNQISQYRNGGN